MFIRLTFMLALALLWLTPNDSYAQHICSSEEVLERQLQENPQFRKNREAIERQTEQFIQAGIAQNRAVVTIPVVFNVVWLTPDQNISDAQIATQLKVLNEDFRRMNADAVNTPSVWQSIGADCEVNFCLAQQDPNGQPTSGIRRRQTTAGGFSDDDQVKFDASGGLDIWDRDKYLNIWVCDLGYPLMGYAQFPGGSPTTDGVVLDYTACGTIGTAVPPYALGRVASHEVGHWLNLKHIWGGILGCLDGDGVSDTPNQGNENYGCPDFPETSCFNGPNGDMFMNYMDYTDDACKNIFTLGQKNRIQACFAAGEARAALLSSPGCQAPPTCGIPSGLIASNITQVSAKLSWNAVSGASSYTLKWKLSTASTWNTVTGIATTSYNLVGLSPGKTYQWKVQSVCPGLPASDFSSTKQFTTLSDQPPVSCKDVFEPNNSLTTARQIFPGNTYQATIGAPGDNDWFYFGNALGTPHIKVELWNLPDNYDLQLYKGAQLIHTSDNLGTLQEQIVYNYAPVGNGYYVHVYGVEGASDSTSCYYLKVSLSNTPWPEVEFGSDGNNALQGGPGTALSETNLETAFMLYPNPAKDVVLVDVPVSQMQEAEVSLLDISGKILLQESQVLDTDAHQVLLNLGKLPNSVYFVQVRSGAMFSVRKLVVQH